MEDHTFDLEHDHLHAQVGHDDATQAVLASLRAAIIDPPHAAGDEVGGQVIVVEGEEELANADANAGLHQDDEDTMERYVHDQDEDEIVQDVNNQNPTQDTHTEHISQILVSIIEKGLQSLSQQIKNDQSILDELNSPNAIQNLAKNLKILNENNKRNVNLIKNLSEQLKSYSHNDSIDTGDGDDHQNLISAFTSTSAEQSPFVLRSEYDALKSRYEALASGKKERKSRSSNKQSHYQQDNADPRLQSVKEVTQDGTGYASPGAEGRKKRSIKLEHLVHQKANRRLGVEYQVANFEAKGARELPAPNSDAPKAEDSISGVDEFRPDFKAELSSPSVKPFIDQVVQDCIEAWQSGVLGNEPDIDIDRITNSVHIYWTRLGKRYDEQLHRERGEVHRDEISRRKQNTYRRQQSLLARRLAAFDSSPLNVCKLRALYRTLLTIDFAAPTQDSPDPKREYTEEEWNAYRKLACGSRAAEAHEVIDQFWLSSMARQLLIILDVYSADMNARARKKGRPKQPNPTFHLPSRLWDKSTLPTIRPKDASGLPITGTPGIVLFKFHVDEQVQKDNPEWAKGLYDNPPIPDEDSSLPSLPEVMSMGIYTSFKSQLKEAKEKSNPKLMSAEEVEEMNNRIINPDDAIEIDQSMLDSTTLQNENGTPPTTGGDYATLIALNKLNNLANSGSETAENPSTSAFTTSQHNPLGGLSGIGEHAIGPSPGSSMRARKLGKRSVSEVPGGAATPVPKRRRKTPQSQLMMEHSPLGLVDGNDFIHDKDASIELGQPHEEENAEEVEGEEAVEGEVLGDKAFLDGL
ncbi:hypothetical protein I204_05351 [Kwoniella mangroviensis CBS 8886]|nr:hypothetical protein I204_05351 [Kwoniella mangroviensis CBS 8886]